MWRFLVILPLLCMASPLCSAQQPPLQLSLADAERLALQNNPRVPSAEFTARAAGQEANVQRSAYLPSVNGLVTAVGADNGSRIAAGGLTNPAVYSRVASGVAVNQIIADFGRTKNLIDSAKLHAQALDRNTELTKDAIVLLTERAYFAVLRAIALLSVAQETVKARQLVVDQTNALAESKLKSSLDVSFANVNLADAQLQLAAADNEQKAAEAQFANALGLPQQTGFTLREEALPTELAPDISALIREAIVKRSDLAGLRIELASAQRFTEAERDLKRPTIAATAALGLAPAGVPQVPDRYGVAGVNVNIPVFNGGLFTARRAEAEFKASAVEQNVRDLENRITRDVRVAWLDATTAYRRMGLTAKLLDQAKLSLDLAQNRYNLGLSSIVELSQAQLNLTSAQIVDTSARYEYQSQRAVLDYQIGAIR